MAGHRPPKCASQPRLRARAEQEGGGPSRTGSKQRRPEAEVQFPEQSWSGPGGHRAETVGWKARRQNWVRTQRPQRSSQRRGAVSSESGPRGLEGRVAGCTLGDSGKTPPGPAEGRLPFSLGFSGHRRDPGACLTCLGSCNKSAHPHSSSQLNTLIISALWRPESDKVHLG